MLQQPTAVRPFVRKFVIFLAVARTAGYDNIRGIVCAATRQGNDVIYLIVFSCFLLAVVAPSLLISILPPYISSNKMSLCLTLNSASLNDIGTSVCFTRLSLPPFLVALLYSLLMSLILSFPILFLLFRGSFAVLFSQFSVGNTSIPITVPLAHSMQTSSILFLVSFLSFPDFCSLFRLTIFCFSLFAFALLTLIAESIEPSFMRVEVIQSSGEQLPTWAFTLLRGGIMRYSIVHGKGHSLSSRTGMLAHRQCKPFLVTPLYHKMAWEASL